MWLQGLTGFIIGFIIGMVVNAILLRQVPKSEYMTNKNLRMRYGGLNWFIAILGMIIALKL